MEEKRPHRPSASRSSGASPQAQYRLYFFQGQERRISYSHEFEADDDDHAVHVAEAWREGRTAELWCRNRKVKSWDPEG